MQLGRTSTKINISQYYYFGCDDRTIDSDSDKLRERLDIDGSLIFCMALDRLPDFICSSASMF